MSSYDQNTVLHEAAKKGKYETVKQLLANKADPNMVDKWGITPLHYASGRRQKEVVELLLAHHADPNLVNKCGYTPLHWASQEGYAEVVKVLLAHHADPNLANKYGHTPLLLASGNGHKEAVELLLAHHADPNLANEDGETPLRWASENGHAEVVELLLAHGADPKDIPPSFGCPMIMTNLLVHGTSPSLALECIRQYTYFYQAPVVELVQRWPVIQPLQILCQRVIRVYRVDTSNTPPLLMAPLDPRDVLEVERERRSLYRSDDSSSLS